MLVQADVLRKPETEFIKMIESAENWRKRVDYITGGIKPDQVVRGVIIW